MMRPLVISHAASRVCRSPCNNHNLVKLGRQSRCLSLATTKNDNYNADAINDIWSLPPRFLRQMDASLWDPHTHQRSNVSYDHHSGKPLQKNDDPISQEQPSMTRCSLNQEDNVYHVEWSDGLQSQYSKEWVELELQKWRGNLDAENEHGCSQQTYWKHLTEDSVRNSDLLSLQFQDAVLTEEGRSRAIQALYQYGFLLVTQTPIDDGGSGVAVLAASLGGGSIKDDNPTSLVGSYAQQHSKAPIMLPHGTDGPMRTLYGTVWSTSSSHQSEGASVADSAYGQDGLPLHTDMTYYQDPPGLQIFTMVQPAVKGGESAFGDGFAVAQALRDNDPDAFETLSHTVRRYRCIDDATGWHLEAHGPVIQTRNSHFVSIRHNDLDRLPDLPPVDMPPNEVQGFYERLDHAHRVWDDLLTQDDFRLVMALQPGDTMVVANHRCFHGRYSFETTQGNPRAVIGCYMSNDELLSRFRQEGFAVP